MIWQNRHRRGTGVAMNHILGLRGLLHRSDVRALLSDSLYQPTPNRLSSWIGRLADDVEVFVYGYLEKDELVGVLAARRIPLAGQAREMEILAITIDRAHRGRGMGRALLQFLIDRHNPIRVYAETDRDALPFYQHCGFSIEALGEKHAADHRFRCVWQRPDRRGEGRKDND